MTRPRSLRAGELRVSGAPDRLAIHGLGSCVAVFVYDPAARIGGLAHILLPGPPRRPTEHVGRYATTTVGGASHSPSRVAGRATAAGLTALKRPRNTARRASWIANALPSWRTMGRHSATVRPLVHPRALRVLSPMSREAMGRATSANRGFATWF